jgi:hypothetical protein
MALVTTQAQFEDLLRRKSLILAFDPSKRQDSRMPPQTTRAVDLSPGGIRRELYELNSEELDQFGDPIGRIPFARKRLKEEIAKWKAFKASQRNAPKDMEPTGTFAESINKYNAMIEVFSEESRKLNALLKQSEPKPVEPNKRQLRARERSGKIRNGKLVEFGGRKVLQNDHNEDYFPDTGQLVQEYLTEFNQKQKEKRNARNKKRRRIVKGRKKTRK